MKRTKKAEEDAEQRGKRKLGMQAKMLLTMLSSLLLVLAITGVVLLNKAQTEVTQLTNASINGQAQSIKLETEAYFNNFFPAMDVFSNSPTVQQAIREAEANGSTYDFRTSPAAAQLMQELKAGLQSLPEGTKSLFMASAANSQVVKSDGSFTGSSFVLSERGWWKQLVANGGSPVVSGAYEDVSGGTVVTVAVAIHQGNKIAGAIGANISLDHVIGLMKQFKVGNTGFAMITDGENNIIYHPDESIVMKNINDTDYDPCIKEAFNNNQDMLNCTYQRGEGTFHGTSYYIPSVGWQVLGTMPHEEFTAEMSRFGLVIILCFVLTALLLAVVVSLNVGAMVRPIKKLENVANRLSQGELDVEVDTQRTDEIGDLSRSISKIVERLKTYIVYIEEVAGVLEQIGSRNLIFTLEQDYVGEFHKLKTAMNSVQAELSQAIFTIADTTAQVDAGAGNMSGGAQVLAQGATEQASTIQELAATIQDLTREASEESARASETSQDATTIGNKVIASNQQMHDLLTAMGKISNQAGEIAKIVKAVEDIAFQTNILALNAAVEAARAGAAGKGFAVVADEVRNLAGKSSKAAESITEMIQTTIGVVNEGAQMADATAASLDEAAREMGDVVSSIDQIVEKYQEEASQLNEVSVGIDQVSAVVQTNSATAEESAATAEELTAQVATMKALVDSFQLDEQYRQE